MNASIFVYLDIFILNICKHKKSVFMDKFISEIAL